MTCRCEPGEPNETKMGMMTALLKDDTEPLNQYDDNEPFRRWLTNVVFERTLEGTKTDMNIRLCHRSQRHPHWRLFGLEGIGRHNNRRRT